MRPIAGRLQGLVVKERPQRLEHIFELGYRFDDEQRSRHFLHPVMGASYS
jgi:hypothetical protein